MKCIIVFALIFIGGCIENKLKCYERSIAQIKQESSYSRIMKLAYSEMSRLQINNKKNFFIDSSYIDAALIDDAIFFNSKRSKCILLVLQKTADDLRSDRVLIIQGTYTKAGWSFLPHRLPAVPEVICTIKKPVSKGHSHNNSFDILSKKGRLFVLTAGTVKGYNCIIDSKYWFGE